MADWDDDDRIGPDSDKNDFNKPPTPGEPPPLLLSTDNSALASSPSPPGCAPAPAPPLKLKPPADELPLNAPNLLVIAAIFGEMTAWMRL